MQIFDFYTFVLFQAGRVLHCLVAAHLPLSVFFFTSAFFQDASLQKKKLLDLATLTSIMVATSEHLVILGTHSLVNSFLSPFVFICLTFLSHATNKESKNNYNQNGTHLEDDNRNTIKIEKRLQNGGKSLRNRGKNAHDSDNGMKRIQSYCYNGKCMSDIVNGNDICSVDFQNNKKKEANNGIFPCFLFVKFKVLDKFGLCFCGFAAGITCYIRVDLILMFSLSTIMIYMLHNSTKWIFFGIMLKFGIGFVFALLLGGLDDKFCYGYWFISPVQWFKFNIWHGRSSVLFGWQESSKYFYDIILYSSCTKAQFVVIVLVSLSHLLVSSRINRSVWKKFLGLNLLFICLFTIYSFQRHKEVRFLHNAIVVYYIVAGVSIFQVTEMWRELKPLNLVLFGKLKYPVLLHYGIILLFSINVYIYYPNSKDGSNSNWTYMGVNDSNHINKCLEYVGKQSDSTGLFLDRSIHHTAAYSVINKDIPILTLVHYEFHEFDVRARFETPSVDYFTNHVNISLSLQSRVSNFFTKENFPYLVKFLVNHSKYNYYVLPLARKVSNVGYKQVFSSGSMKVIKRKSDSESNKILSKQVTRIPVGTNATILEYEGSWCITYGLYEEAVIRLKTAVELDSRKVRPYQLLAIVYKKLKMDDQMRKILEKCYKNNGIDICSNLQQKTVLHEQYEIKLFD